MSDVRTLIEMSYVPRDEQPERRIHSAPGAMRNPEGVSYKAEC